MFVDAHDVIQKYCKLLIVITQQFYSVKMVEIP